MVQLISDSCQHLPLKNISLLSLMAVEDINTELSKILSKVMQSSYKRKDVNEIIERIAVKIGKIVFETHKEDEIRSLRMEFENIRKSFYDL